MASKKIVPEKGAEVPGPGSYDPFRSSLAKQSIKIGQEKRLFDYESEIPGPGSNSAKATQHTTSTDHSVLAPADPRQSSHVRTE